MNTLLRSLLFCTSILAGGSSLSIVASEVESKILAENKDLIKTGSTSATDNPIRAFHSIFVENKKLDYESIAGSLEINDDKEKPQATLFFTAYFKKEAKKNSPPRPIIFCFNGGPGSSSVWLHMGLLGPKKVILNDCEITSPPSTYETNPYTLLDSADLVFIDPVSTGFSKANSGINPKQFHGIEEDIECFSEFIRLFLTCYQRWDSPRFILGESYGTIRAVGLAKHLQDASFIDLNGIILLSPCLDFQSYDLDNGNDLPYILHLPSYAATAWYHKKLSPELQAKPLQNLLAEVQNFALQDYSIALLLGNRLDEEKKEKMISRLSQYTGLEPRYIQDASLRITNHLFFKELLKNESKIIGRFDGRYVGFDHLSSDSENLRDPSLDAITGPFTSAFQQYLAKELAVTRTDPYRVLNSDAVFPWNFSYGKIPAGLGYVRTSPSLSRLMEKSPNLKVFIAGGYYDMATPYFAAEHMIATLEANPSLLKNITMAYYEAGHMMYLHEPSLAKMKEDLREFMKL